MDGRRHSVDIPISKTLVALRRVRSLRDPSTHSLTKFSALVDNFNWDTNSCNGISLRFGGDALVVSEPFGACEEDDETEKDDEPLENKSKIPYSSNAGFSPSSPEDNALELACTEPFKHEWDEPNVKSPADLGGKYKNRLRNRNDIVSRVGSPCACPSDSSMLDGSTSENGFESRSNNLGCGISCCWSGTPRLRGLSLVSDDDNYPLLSGEVGETTDVSGQSRSWKRAANELVLYSETPRSLSQKFKPKSFSELVGQNVVARSLLGAIAKGRITSLYLFHGARGTGKTCAARIFAAALNCLSLEQHRPCGLCQECLLYFAGRSRDAKEVDSVRINRTNRVRSLIKSAAIPPVSSRYKVFIVDECQLLRGETWAALLNSLDGFSRHTVFIMVTPDIDKVPKSAVARSQRYHFPKIKDVDISSKLRKVCIDEGLEFEQLALDFIAAKSNGSLRDAEMMLDQLSLLSKQITMTLASDLIGTVSDDELLNMLDLALSADTSNTVKSARELMRSRIDPMQLISQLANIIMDILAGNLQEESSEVKRSFLQKHSCETDLQKLRHALKILSESEKQLRASKNQTTWLTVALLHLNSIDSSLSDPNESRMSLKATNSRDGDCFSTSSPGERSKHIITCDCDCDRLPQSALVELQGTLEVIWLKATEKCESKSLKSFLRKRGKLTSVYVKKGMAVAELEFDHPDYVSKAEKSWKVIASTLQFVLGRNVELRMKSGPIASRAKTGRRSSFSFFNCSRRMYSKSKTPPPSGSRGDQSDFTNKAVASHIHNLCSHHQTLRNTDGNALSTGAYTPNSCSHDSCKDQHPELIASNQSEIQPQDKIVSSPIHGEASFDAYICSEYPYIMCNASSNNHTSDSKHAQRSAINNWKVHCWRTPQLSVKVPCFCFRSSEYRCSKLMPY